MIRRHRVRALEQGVLNEWDRFTIWGAGRDGRNFFKALSDDVKKKVICFADINPDKIAVPYVYATKEEGIQYEVPVIHYKDSTPPFVTCVGLNRTDGAFEANLASLNLEEGKDFYYFC